jgi:hypothetical protein
MLFAGIKAAPPVAVIALYVTTLLLTRLKAKLPSNPVFTIPEFEEVRSTENARFPPASFTVTVPSEVKPPRQPPVQ